MALIPRTRYYNPIGYSPIARIPPVGSTGELYRDAELRLIAAARAAGGPSAGGGIGGGNAASFIPYVGGGIDSPAAQRNYEAEKARVAQLVEQDQLIKKYRVADLAKAYNAAKGEEREKLGMEIFALTNPTLARNVKPGQAGYETIQETRRANMPFAGALSAIPPASSSVYQKAFTTPPGDIVQTAFGEPTGNAIQASLGAIPSLEKSGVTFNPVDPKNVLGGMSITDAYTSKAFGPSQDNLINLKLALLKEDFNRRLK
jgi:hypothetical protein